MSYKKLRAWFETFTDADPFTMNVIGALVDVAESAGHVFAGHQSMDDGLSLDAREAIEALENLETALDDAEIDAEADSQTNEPRLREAARLRAELLQSARAELDAALVEAADGTLHNSIDYWQQRAKKAEARLTDVSRDYEELRRETDGGSESMTHVDAIDAIRTYKERVQNMELQVKSWKREAEMNQS